VRIPVEGNYDVAFMMDTPQFLHCFNAAVAPNEADKDKGAGQLAVVYDIGDRRIPVGEPKSIRFRLQDAASGAPAGDITDVAVMYYRSDGRGRTVQAARTIGEGVYETTVEVDMPATYYLFVAAPSRGLAFSDQPFLSLMAQAKPAEPRTEAAN
jgi:hypothetical protein